MVGAPCRWFAPPHRGCWGHGGLWGWHTSRLLYPMAKGQVAPGGVRPCGCHCTPGLLGPVLVDASPASHKLLCLCFFFFLKPRIKIPLQLCSENLSGLLQAFFELAVVRGHFMERQIKPGIQWHRTLQPVCPSCPQAFGSTDRQAEGSWD